MIPAIESRCQDQVSFAMKDRADENAGHTLAHVVHPLAGPVDGASLLKLLLYLLRNILRQLLDQRRFHVGHARQPMATNVVLRRKHVPPRLSPFALCRSPLQILIVGIAGFLRTGALLLLVFDNV